MASLSVTKPQDKADLALLLVALDAAHNQLRIDEAGWWTIQGKHGYISKWSDAPDDFTIYIAGSTPRKWGFHKKRLLFCEVTQDGDDEGVLRMRRMPSHKEAEVVRDVVGLHKRPDMSDEHIASATRTIRAVHERRRPKEGQ